MRTQLATALFFGLCSVTSAAPRQGAPCAGGQAFDDGTAERFIPDHYIGPSMQVYLVSCFTPPSLPFVYEQACVNVPGLEPFDVFVFDDDGSSGDPNTVLREVPVTRATASDWVTCDLGALPVASGSVWIGVRLSASPIPHLGADTSASHPFRWAEQEPLPPPLVLPWSSTYTNLGPAALMIRAFGEPAAEATVRRGSGVNPLCYFAPAPRLGHSWTARVSHSIVALQTRVYFYALAASGPVLPFGELLFDPTSPRYGLSVKASSGTTDAHVFAIPSDAALLGLSSASQALVIEPGGAVLCNAIDLRLGR